MEDDPARVPERAKQTGEVRAGWAWTGPAVWTERVLPALENGVKGISPFHGWGSSLFWTPVAVSVNPL